MKADVSFQKGGSLAIGRLERFLADWKPAQATSTETTQKPQPTGRKVAALGVDLPSHGCRGFDPIGASGDLYEPAQGWRSAGLGHSDFAFPNHRTA